LTTPDAPELLRLLMLGGVDRDLEKVAALAAAPLIGQKAPSQNPGLAADQAAHLPLHRRRPRGTVLRPG